MDGTNSGALTTRASDELALRPEYPAHDAFAFQEMWRTLLRRRVIVAGVFTATVLIGLIYALVRPPVYESTAVLLMRPNEPQVASTEQQRAPTPDNGYVQSQVEILKSPALARQVADRLNLGPETGPGAAAAARKVAENVEVQRRDGTYVVQVSARSANPQTAAMIANDIVRAYFLSREQARVAYAEQTGEWLDARLAELRSEVRTREDEVEQFRSANGLLMVDGAMLAEQQLREAETSVVSARADQAERQARYRQVDSMVRGGRSAQTTAAALNSETMAQLRARQADVTRRIAEYNERYGERHPQVQAAQAERDGINHQIEAEAQRIAENLNEEADIASARVATLQAHLASVRGRLVGNNVEQVRMRELERNAQAARAVYENFLLRSHEISGAAGLGGDAQVVAAATAPDEPVSRSPLIVIMFAAALGAALGLLAAFLAEQFSKTLLTGDDVRAKIGVPLLTSIPLLNRHSLARLTSTEKHPAGFLAARPMSGFAEAIRILRSRITHAGLQGAVKVVAVTSAKAREGKSSAALSLARITALSGRRAIILDCDLRRRSLNHLLCIEPVRGLAQVLRGEAHWREVTGRDEYGGTDVLPAAVEEFSPEDVFNTDAMRQLVRDLAQVYDLVVLDCPPVLALADVRDLATMADGVVLVARSNQTDVLALQTALNELNAVNARVLGVALNGVDSRSAGTLSYADPIYFSHATRNAYFT
jgi:succinoglycan biosynthesis transport protein ExoP